VLCCLTTFDLRGHIMEIRFVKANALWLSPEFEQVIVGVLSAFCLLTSMQTTSRITLLSLPQRDEKWVFSAFEQLCIDTHGGHARPHWAKAFYNFAHLSIAYRRMPEWKAFRAQLDPNELFVNDFVANLIRPE
jgi:hypothetical protein